MQGHTARGYLSHGLPGRAMNVKAYSRTLPNGGNCKRSEGELNKSTQREEACGRDGDENEQEQGRRCRDLVRRDGKG